MWGYAKKRAHKHFAYANPAQMKSWLSVSSSRALVQYTCLQPSRPWSHTNQICLGSCGVSSYFRPFAQPLLEALFPPQTHSQIGFWCSKAEEWFCSQHKTGRGEVVGKVRTQSWTADPAAGVDIKVEADPAPHTPLPSLQCSSHPVK